MESVLESILINTYNPNQALRLQAEEALKNFLQTQGSLTAIINCISNVNMHRELRLATGIVMKNRLRDYWSEEAGHLPSIPEEKEHVKNAILNILLNENDNSIRSILAESIKIISEFDYPHKWPNLIPIIVTNIQNPDVLRVYNSLLALRKLAKRYEYKAKEERGPLNEMLQATFPFLQQLMSMIINNNSLEAASVMRICLKIFWSSTCYTLPYVQGVDVNLWFQLIAQIVDKRIPEATEGIEPLGQPTDLDERKVWPWWKLKKWAGRIMTHFIQRYGNPRYCTEEDKPFAEYFRSNSALTLLGPCMNNLHLKAQGGYITDDLHRCCLTYLNNCTEMSPTYKVIKPHLQFILFQVVFPTLAVTEDQIKLFEEDPIEFIRLVHDPLSDWLSPTIAATNLLQMLSRYRQKDVLPIFLPFIENVLVEYNNSPPASKDFRKKDGALVALAALVKIMNDSDVYRNHLLPILSHHILPEFQSPVPYLRARACWVIEYFSDLDWDTEAAQADAAAKKKTSKKKKNGKKSESKENLSAGDILRSVLQNLLTCLRDPTLPVQSSAACSLRALISKEGATDLLRPFLPNIIGEYFRIMDEVENESILSALQAIVLQYGEEIADFAPNMTTHLVQAFNKYADDGGEEEESAFNACQCLDTIDAILEAVQDRPDTLSQLEPLLLPLFLQVLNSHGDAFEYIDTVVHMISGFTYSSETISATMWAVCGPLLKALNDWAIDYIIEMMVPILNYITKGLNTFVQGSFDGRNFVEILFECISKTFENEDGYSGRDIKAGATLLSSMLISAKQFGTQMHPLVPQILSMSLQRLTIAKKASLKISLIEVGLAALYFDAPYTLGLMQADAQMLTFFFSNVFENLKVMEKDFTERLVVLAFTSILSIQPLSSLPPLLSANVQSMFQQIIRELVLIEEEAAKEGEDDDEEDYDEDDDDFDMDDDHLGADIDDDEDDDLDVKDMLRRTGGKMKKSAPDDDEEDYDESDPVSASIRRAQALHVPEGGYNEDEDCVNAEDEEYREALEHMDKEERVKRELYMAGEPVDDEDEDDFEFVSPIETMDITKAFVEAMNIFAQRDPQVIQQLRANLDQEDSARLQELIEKANRPPESS